MIEEFEAWIDGTSLGKLIASVVVIVMVPLNALVNSWAFGKVWHWFVYPQFGWEPVAAAWYGIWAIAGLMLLARVGHLAHRDGWSNASQFMWRSLEMPIACLAVLASTWTTGSILGWI